METITIESPGVCLADDARAALVGADVIIGVDNQTGQEFTVFGTPPLESTGSFKRLSAMRTVRVSVDRAIGELETLIAVVQAIKGLAHH